jgi:WhiB family redox-sensing transcriptional regulator
MAKKRTRDWNNRVAIVEAIIDLEVPEDASWHESAACFGLDTEIFFDGSKWDQAIAVCSDCPVRYVCLKDSMSEAKQYGIWGGEKPEDRYRIRRALHNTMRKRGMSVK